MTFPLVVCELNPGRGKRSFNIFVTISHHYLEAANICFPLENKFEKIVSSHVFKSRLNRQSVEPTYFRRLIKFDFTGNELLEISKLITLVKASS